ncbi:MAG: AEC family transporter, partial [Leptolyngbyaceae cyanobacterium MO_188.B28]|nr:AEC family transporter [Leptolyngbyaceae cyanobacterium MO_188.B28]
IALLAVLLINTALLYLIAVGLGRSLKFSRDERKGLIAIALFANVGNMGLPFVLFSLGQAGLERATVYLVGVNLLVTGLFPIVLKGTGIRTGVVFTLRQPVLWSVLAGLAIQASGGMLLPQAIGGGVVLLGGGAIPMALLTLGVQLSRTQFVFGRYELFGAGIRLLVSPLLAYGTGRLLGLEGLDLQVAVVQSAMPVAVNSLIWVTELGGDAVRVARTIVLSTLLSFFTLPGVLWLSAF